MLTGAEFQFGKMKKVLEMWGFHDNANMLHVTELDP